MVPRDVLQIDLDALGRLAPALRTLAAEVQQPPPLAEASTDTPTLGTAASISTETMTRLRTQVADRFTTVGDRIDKARTEFASASDNRAAVITDSASQAHRPAPVVTV